MQTLKDLLIIALLVALLWFVVIEPRIDPAPIAQTAPYFIDAITGPTAQAHDPVNVMGTQQAPATIQAIIEALTPTPRPSLNEFLGLTPGTNAGIRNTLVPLP